MTLNDLLGSSNSWVAARAQDALEIQSDVATHSITSAQAVELLQDLIATDELNRLVSDFTTRTNLVNAVNEVISVVSALKSVL